MEHSVKRIRTELENMKMERNSGVDQEKNNGATRARIHTHALQMQKWCRRRRQTGYAQNTSRECVRVCGCVLGVEIRRMVWHAESLGPEFSGTCTLQILMVLRYILLLDSIFALRLTFVSATKIWNLFLTGEMMSRYCVRGGTSSASTFVWCLESERKLLELGNDNPIGLEIRLFIPRKNERESDILWWWSIGITDLLAKNKLMIRRQYVYQKSEDEFDNELSVALSRKSEQICETWDSLPRYYRSVSRNRYDNARERLSSYKSLIFSFDTDDFVSKKHLNSDVKSCKEHHIKERH